MRAVAVSVPSGELEAKPVDNTSAGPLRVALWLWLLDFCHGIIGGIKEPLRSHAAVPDDVDTVTYEFADNRLHLRGFSEPEEWLGDFDTHHPFEVFIDFLPGDNQKFLSFAKRVRAAAAEKLRYFENVVIGPVIDAEAGTLFKNSDFKVVPDNFDQYTASMPEHRRQRAGKSVSENGPRGR